MIQEAVKNLDNFFVVGINYKKTDATLRGQFAINNTQYQSLLESRADDASQSFFILSTCNRTEIFGFGNAAKDLGKFLCTVTEGSFEDFERICYCSQGEEAISHLFKVAAGLDSQILGDYEVTAQIKMAVRQSKAAGMMNNFLERLVNEVFACTKLIRTNTIFSSGTVSVSFAAIQCIKEKFAGKNIDKIVLIGAGKIGRNTAKNILHYIPNANLYIINRTQEKALELAASTSARVISYEDRTEVIDEADVIIVATQADEPILSEGDLTKNKDVRLFIDLSVPCNIDKNVLNVANVNLIGVDELSKVNDQTLTNRRKEIPKVKEQIARSIDLFFQWYNQRSDAKKLMRLKTHLQKINDNDFVEDHSIISIQKTVNGMAKKLKQENKAGCFYLQALNEYISINTN